MQATGRPEIDRQFAAAPGTIAGTDLPTAGFAGLLDECQPESVPAAFANIKAIENPREIGFAKTRPGVADNEPLRQECTRLAPWFSG